MKAVLIKRKSFVIINPKNKIRVVLAKRD